MPRPQPRRLRRVPVDALPADPVAVVLALRHLAGARRLTALAGTWTTGALVTADPVRVLSHDEAIGGGPDDALGARFDELLAAIDDPTEVTEPAQGPDGPGVGGGWTLLLGHRLGRWTGRVRGPQPPVVGPRLPVLHAAFHDHVLRLHEGRWWAESLDTGDGAAAGRADALAREAVAGLDRDARHGRPGLPEVGLVEVPAAAAHMAAVEQVVTAVRAGDLAQANVCSRFGLRLPDAGPAAVGAWAALVRALGPDRAALVTAPWGALVGASPESYLSLAQGWVTSAPIKGTRPLGEDRALRDSAKDTSENVMIVDLVRNDLARVCEPGSVRVEELLAVRPHAGVSHLVSRVGGRLLPGSGTGAVLRATFPPGSVTGTPKQRATEVTDGVEASARGAHTGTVGWVGAGGTAADLAVTIRSLEVSPDGSAALGVGGGIVADSTPAEEWHEVLTKAAPLLRALAVHPPAPGPTTASAKGLADVAQGLIETVLAVDGRVVEVADHTARLRRSVWELTGAALDVDVESALAAAAARAGAGAHRLRVRAPLPARDQVPSSDGTGGAVVVETEPWHRPASPRRAAGLRLAVVEAPPDGLERHKYADRTLLDLALADALAGRPDVDDVAFAAPDGLLETTRSCLLAVVPGPDGAPGLVTPACDGRVLPGTTRQVLVDLARRRGWAVRFGALDDDVLARADGLVAANALRGAQWVAAVGRHRWPAPSPAVVDLAEELLARWRLPAG